MVLEKESLLELGGKIQKKIGGGGRKEMNETKKRRVVKMNDETTNCLAFI